jgi:hypothetical protein
MCKESKMNEADLIWIATISMGKGYGYEQTKYGDYLYGKEEEAENVWRYVEECEEIGRTAFKEKYKNVKMFAGF